MLWALWMMFEYDLVDERSWECGVGFMYLARCHSGLSNCRKLMEGLNVNVLSDKESWDNLIIIRIPQLIWTWQGERWA